MHEDPRQVHENQRMLQGRRHGEWDERIPRMHGKVRQMARADERISHGASSR